jgi:hypothetical protein
MVCLGSSLCLAKTWTGKLVDAACKDQSATQGATPPSSGQMLPACEAGRATTSFGVELSDGRVLKLDGTGNTKAAELVRTNNKESMSVTVSGSLDGKTLKVESIDIQ